jgi:hypothetical protein
LREVHEKVLRDKQEELKYFTKLFDAFGSLSKKISDETLYYQEEVAKLEA